MLQPCRQILGQKARKTKGLQRQGINYDRKMFYSTGLGFWTYQAVSEGSVLSADLRQRREVGHGRRQRVGGVDQR